jgi:hypothetical protein
VQLFSLQKGPGSEQLGSVAFPIIDLSSRLDEASGPFMDTAAVMKSLDLVITCDTAIGHLAGALGVPTWIALAFVADWRWLRDRDDSPWYPSVRLFRQPRRGAWEPVFQQMAAVLDKRLSNGSVLSQQGRLPRQVSIPVDTAPGELIDRITILEIKSAQIKDAAKLANVRRELAVLEAARNRALSGSEKLSALTAELKQVNERLWQVEDDIRLCERHQDFGPRFIELARSVYRENDRRAAIKRQINELLGSHLIEEKSYTAPVEATRKQ